MSAPSTKPYLIRAIYEWCVDYGFTPYLTVKVTDKTKVPMEYVKNGEIVLNISQGATRNLKIENERIHFSARFGGVSRELSIPIGAVTTVFARENGQGLVFQAREEEESAQPTPPPTSTPAAGAPGKKGHLKIVK